MNVGTVMTGASLNFGRGQVTPVANIKNIRSDEYRHQANQTTKFKEELKGSEFALELLLAQSKLRYAK